MAGKIGTRLFRVKVDSNFVGTCTTDWSMDYQFIDGDLVTCRDVLIEPEDGKRSVSEIWQEALTFAMEREQTAVE